MFSCSLTHFSCQLFSKEPRDDQVLVVPGEAKVNAKAAKGKDGYDNPEWAHISVKLYYTQELLNFRKGILKWLKQDVRMKTQSIDFRYP